MAGHSTHEITGLLQAWGDGDERALERLMPLVYEELRQAAHRYMAREAPGHTLQTTALVNEVYLRLAGVRRGLWNDRAHFFALCAKLMRRILTDFARSRRSVKRGGRADHVALDEALLVSQEPQADLLALHEALERLEAFDHRKSRVVELRFYGGLSEQETADVLHVSPATVQREWRLAKDWLFRELRNEHADRA
jgi:RNA polymerase sigma factor (TIGR02999 family)